MIKISKTVYDAPEASDGERLLVMRLWPRGVSKEKLKIAAWEKELGTEPELIKKWKGGMITWAAFAKLTARASKIKSRSSKNWRNFLKKRR